MVYDWLKHFKTFEIGMTRRTYLHWNDGQVSTPSTFHPGVTGQACRANLSKGVSFEQDLTQKGGTKERKESQRTNQRNI